MLRAVSLADSFFCKASSTFSLNTRNLVATKSSRSVCWSFTRKMSSKVLPKVYVTRNVPQIGIELLKPHCEIYQWKSDDPVTKEALLKNVPGIDALFCLLTDKIDSDIINAAGNSLKIVSTMSVGYEHIDLQTCKEKNIPVGYTPDVLTDATAELTVALLLSVSRRIVEGVSAVKTGEWSTWAPLWMCGQGLQHSTVGIVGLGRIGMAVARRIKPFGPSSIIYSGNTEKAEASQVGAKFVDLDQLLAESDFVIATCPMTEQTKGMFNKNLFQKMKKNAMFVNTSRGGVVNQEDLYEALTRGTIAAAGLDVTVPEPLPTDNPLLTLPNCVVLPHIGSATVATRSKMSEIAARNVLAVLNGTEMVAQVKA